MAQYDDRHLTTEQLSALLDQQLSPQEQAEYNAHLNACQQCQKAMADLKMTVALLHALPQPTLPRSFVLPQLPATVAQTQEQSRQNIRPLTTATRRTPSHRVGYVARRSVRALSTIAAVIGLFFILSSFAASLPHAGLGGGTSSSNGSIPVAGSGRGSTITTPHVKTPQGCNQSNQSTPQPVTCGTQHTPAAAPHQTPGLTVPATPTPSIKDKTKQNQVSSPTIDLNSPQAHLGLGAILLLIGVLGVVLTRKRRE